MRTELSWGSTHPHHSLSLGVTLPCLLARVSPITPAARDAMGRRPVVMRLEEQLKKERKA